MRLALVQQRAGHDKGENTARGLAALERAAADGADLICFAELGFERFYPQHPADENFAALAEPVPGPTTEAFSRRAKDLGRTAVKRQ